jgi:hypothetical protein
MDISLDPEVENFSILHTLKHLEKSLGSRFYHVLKKKTEKEIARNFLGKILNFMQNEK